MRRAAVFLATFALLLASTTFMPSTAHAGETLVTSQIDYGSRDGKTTTYGQWDHFLVIIYDGAVAENKIAKGGGTVTWIDNGVEVATTPAYGAYSYLGYVPPVGQHTLVSRYNGDGPHGTAATRTSTTFSVVRDQASATLEYHTPYTSPGFINSQPEYTRLVVQAVARPLFSSSVKGIANITGTATVKFDNKAPVSYSLTENGPGPGPSPYRTVELDRRWTPGDRVSYSVTYSGDANYMPASSTSSFEIPKLKPPIPMPGPRGCFIGTCTPEVAIGQPVTVVANEYQYGGIPSYPYQPTGPVVVCTGDGREVTRFEIDRFDWTHNFSFAHAGRQCLIAKYDGDKRFIPQDHIYLGCWDVIDPNNPAQPPASVAEEPEPTAGYVFSHANGLLEGKGLSSRDRYAAHGLTVPIVGTASTNEGRGYWQFAADGKIINIGLSSYHDSTEGMNLNKPIAAMAAARSRDGYWLVASDGGVFSFGDAAFHGSTGDKKLNQPIVGMASTQTGNGYWLAARDGGVFTFGDAPFLGSGVGRGDDVVGFAAR